MTINEMVEQAHANSKAKGWWDDCVYVGYATKVVNIDRALPLIPQHLMLIVSEAAEALEDYRNGRMSTTIREDGKPEGFWTEIADIAIRLGDLAGAHGVDLEHEVKQKMAHNRTRPHRHGGKRC